MSKPGKTAISHGLVPVDLKSAKEPLPHQTVMKIFSISIIAQGLPFCRRRVSVKVFKTWIFVTCLGAQCFVMVHLAHEEVLRSITLNIYVLRVL